MQKSYGVGDGGVVAHVILVSAFGPNPSSFLFGGGLLFYLGVCWDRGLDLDLYQGLKILIGALSL